MHPRPHLQLEALGTDGPTVFGKPRAAPAPSWSHLRIRTDVSCGRQLIRSHEFGRVRRTGRVFTVRVIDNMLILHTAYGMIWTS